MSDSIPNAKQQVFMSANQVPDPESAEFAELVRQDRERSEDSAESMAEAARSEEVAHQALIRKRAEGQRSVSLGNGLYHNYSTEAQAGMRQLEQLGYVDVAGLVTLLGTENGITQDEISELLNRPGTDG